MKKIEIIDVLKHNLAGGDCPQELIGKYHPEILSKHIEMAWNYLIKTVAYREAEQLDDWGLLDAFTKTYVPVEVKFDEVRNERYSNLPVSIVDLPRNRGIRFISDIHNQSNQYLYRDNNSVDIYSNLDVSKVIPTPRYYREGDKVFYSGLSSLIPNVLQKLIPNFSSLDDDDEVPIPSAYNKLIFDLVYQQMMNLRPEKLSNDNNSNTI